MKGNYILSCLVFFPMAGAVLTYLIGRKNKAARDYIADGIVILEFAVMFYVSCMYYVAWKLSGNPANSFGYPSSCTIPGFCGMGLRFTLDGFRVLYGWIASFMWMMTTIFSKEYFVRYRNRNRYYFFLLLTLGATMGVFLSADLYTMFIFFEMMSFTSYVWVAHDEKADSLRAAETYLAVAVTGGLVMLMGLLLLYHETGTLDINELYEICRSIMLGSEHEDRRRIL